MTSLFTKTPKELWVGRQRLKLMSVSFTHVVRTRNKDATIPHFCRESLRAGEGWWRQERTNKVWLVTKDIYYV